jgi:two-component system, LytTR family, sensor kinase
MDMRKIVAVILVILTYQLGWAQNIDSLKNVYAQDDANLAALEQLVDYYKTENLDSLNHFANILLKEAKKKNNKELKYKTIVLRANGYIIFNKQEQADSILCRFDASDDLPPEIYIEYIITQGRILKYKQQYDLALTNYYEAIKLIKDNRLDLLLPTTYAEVASVLRENNDLENCTKYYRYALNEATVNNNIELQIDVCYALCRVYNGGITVNLDSSVYYGELGLKIAKRENFESGYANLLFIVSAPIIRKGHYRQGLQMSKEALTYADKYSFSNKKKYYLVNNQGFAYEKLGLYDSAWIKMEEGALLYPKGIDSWRLRYLILKSKGEYAKAIEALEIYKFKSDSTRKKRNATKFSAIQARNEAELQEREVAKLTQVAELQALELSQQRYMLIGVLLLVFFIFSASILFYRQKRLKQQQIITNLELEEAQKRLDIEKQYRESELKALRSQMNPHFMFNALNSIQEYIMTNERKLAGKYLGKFADLMRIYLEQSEAKTISIHDEVETLSLYLELEKLRFEDTLTCTVNIDKNVDTYSTSIPTLIIQPYVENALKHGLLHKKEERKLSINMRCAKEDQLICEIIDNGVGRQRAAEINKMRNPTHKSFATSATKSRLELLNYNSNKHIRVETVDLKNAQGDSEGTKVIITIPV